MKRFNITRIDGAAPGGWYIVQEDCKREFFKVHGSTVDLTIAEVRKTLHTGMNSNVIEGPEAEAVRAAIIEYTGGITCIL